jgi:Zn-dependent protease
MRSWKLGTAFGIGIYVHWTFLLLLAWVLFSTGGANLVAGTYMVGLVVVVFGCVVLHELGHALTARHFGIGTRDITLYPIGGVARLERMSEKPWQEFWIAVAGPAVNVAIAALLLVILLLISPLNVGVPLFVEPPARTISQFLWHLMVLNLWLVGFNLIPAFPMDGGRVLRALLALGWGQLRATEIAARVGVVVAMLMGLWGAFVWGGPMLVLVAAFVFLAGQQELLAVRMRARREQTAAPPEVLPVVRPVNAVAFGSDGFHGLRPTVSVYTWDPKTGAWVREAGSRPVRVQWGSTD